MIKHICDWCGEEVPAEELLGRGLTRLATKTSNITGVETRVSVNVETDGVSNGGQYHELCVLRILVYAEADMRTEKSGG